MIKGTHITLFTPEAEALRAFFRDKLNFPFIDVGEGWLIFDLLKADLGCHPINPDALNPAQQQGESVAVLSFYCDDIQATVAELKGRGIEFTQDIQDAGYGLNTRFRMPGNVEVELYQPYYAKEFPA